MARTKGCRNLLPQEREKIASELRSGATYRFLMDKYGLKSDSALRSICKDFNIDYINSPKKEDVFWEQTIDWLDDGGIFQVSQRAGTEKNVVYISVDDVVEMVRMMAKQYTEMGNRIRELENGEEQIDQG